MRRKSPGEPKLDHSQTRIELDHIIERICAGPHILKNCWVIYLPSLFSTGLGFSHVGAATPPMEEPPQDFRRRIIIANYAWYFMSQQKRKMSVYYYRHSPIFITLMIAVSNSRITVGPDRITKPKPDDSQICQSDSTRPVRGAFFRAS